MGASEIEYARNGEVSIAYQTVGEGPIDLALVGGFVGHLEIFWESPPAARFLNRLASFSRLILWDKREQGLSDRLGQPPTLEQGMDDLRCVLDAVGSERVALVGASEGGPMALLFAASFPERVSSLVLYGTYAKMTRSDDYPEGLPREVLDRFLASVRENWGAPGALALWAPSVAGDEQAERHWRRLVRSGTSPAAATALIRMYYDIDVRPVLSAVTAPALVLHRDRDRVVPVAMARALARDLPGARYVELEGADHLPWTEGADALLDEIEEFVTGTRREREPERMLATILFTDIVDSTERAASSGDREWRRLLERHDELVRRELGRYRGREIKQTGDGFFAAFDGPARAVECAAAISEQVRRLGIEVRAGVHTGECEVRGGDLAGMAVHIGARVGACADAGEVLVSGTVKDLVVGSQLRFDDRGSRELKGVPGEWRLYALAHGG
ncbi:MAG: adenylate/guanylate cyclase domain-containing protein [Candidatus Woesearchaeota archaeon]